MMEPGSTYVEGLVTFKVAIAYGIPVATTAVLALLIMPPRTVREFIVRTISTVACSFLFGPALAGAVIAWKPALMEAMMWLAHHGSDGDDALLAKSYVLGPSMLLAGLPAWWVLGAYMRWMASMRHKGVLAWLADVRVNLLERRPGGRDGRGS